MTLSKHLKQDGLLLIYISSIYSCLCEHTLYVKVSTKGEMFIVCLSVDLISLGTTNKLKTSRRQEFKMVDIELISSLASKLFNLKCKSLFLNINMLRIFT